MMEKMIQQLILAGMRKNPTGSRFDEHCARVELAANTNILGCTACNARNGQWKVPLDKKDNKKLGDVKRSASAATKFMTGLDYLVEECTSDY